MLAASAQIPDAIVARMEGDDIVPVSLRDLVRAGVYVLVGVPGAYSPICTNDHIPSLLGIADDLHNLGVKGIFCISDDNVWALEAWRKTFQNNEKIMFLSDGNRDFLSAAHLASNEDKLFLAGKYARFYAIIKDGMIRRVRFETSVLNTFCTDGNSLRADVLDYVRDQKNSEDRKAS